MANLSQGDKLALSLASKKLHALVRPSIYPVVDLRSKEGLVQFADAMARGPDLRKLVRTCRLEGDVCCIEPEAINFHIDTITRLPLLRKLCFLPEHEVSDGRSMNPMLQKLVSGKALESLRSLHIDLNCRYAQDLPNGLQEQMLQTMFSTPLIKDLQAFYRHRGHDQFSNRSMREITNLQLKKARTKFTDLQTLILQWDALLLPLLSTLIQFPRTLEALTLHISGRYDHALRGPGMTLDSALSPVANSLRELELQFVHRVADNYPETHISISGDFLSEIHSFDGKAPWFPPSIASICITTSRLCQCPRPEPDPFKPFARQQGFV
ncbi:hypothetical protein BDV12DRAFT_192068 [Aspergillus spectabilis]